MSSYTNVFSHLLPVRAPGLGFGALAVRGLDLFTTWFLRGRARRQLRDLDDATLRDIGVNRYDAEIESNKPFWRA